MSNDERRRVINKLRNLCDNNFMECKECGQTDGDFVVRQKFSDDLVTRTITCRECGHRWTG
jgi:DNA-directed RNA polymerase subunit M/transcription elongation factor TFIIS